MLLTYQLLCHQWQEK